MNSSLSFRLLIAAALSTLIALIATGIVLNFLFRSYFEDRIQQELESYLVQLTSNVSIDADGEIAVLELMDPRFAEPLSGYYWQVQRDNRQPVLSQSFWAEPLQIPEPPRRGEIVFSSMQAADDSKLLTGSWIVTLKHENSDVEVLLVVALDQSLLDQSIAGFSRNVLISMILLGVFLVLASWFQVRVGLSPLEKVRAEVNAVKERPGYRLSTDHPTEVTPLVEEVNDLLERQAATIGIARARASDLAHGLKTPLTIMRAISEDLKKTDQVEIAAEIDSQVANMQYFVERELARSRDQSTEIAWCNAAPVVERLVRAFKRRSDGSDMRWHTDIDANCACPFDEYNLTELLGNLIDNAAKWARSEISITVAGKRDSGCIQVADDGPGISEADLGVVLRRGKRLDDTVPGQGLGLAIAEDMARQRGATLDLQNRESGGLAARVSWTRQNVEAAAS